jgi:hypothetical protein
MDEISKLSKAGERMLEKIFRSGDGKENEPYERRNPAQVRGQDMGNSFGQSKGCERTAKQHYFGVS